MATPRLVYYHLTEPEDIRGQPRPALVIRDLGAEGLRLKVFLDPETDGGIDFLNVISKLDGSEPGQWAQAIV